MSIFSKSRGSPLACFRCGSTDLPLAPLWPKQRRDYASFGWVMRQCADCGTIQNHKGIDEAEMMTPEQAAEQAPEAR